MSHAPGMTHCSLSSMNKGTGLTKFRTSIIKPLSKCENVSGLLILRTEPAPEFGRSHSFLRFLSWQSSFERLLVEGLLEPPCCLASSKNLSRPKGSSSNCTGPSGLWLWSAPVKPLSGTNLRKEWKSLLKWQFNFNLYR